MITNTTGAHPVDIRRLEEAVRASNPPLSITTTGTGGTGSGLWAPIPPPPPAVRDQFYGDYGTRTLCMFKVRKIDNGFLIEYAAYEGGHVNQIFAADAKDIGDLVVTKLVEQRLEKS